MRYAAVSGARSRSEIDAYLPDNYAVLKDYPSTESPGHSLYVIRGNDSHGWTLDGYVIPRLQSGLIAATEIPASHLLVRSIKYGFTVPICEPCFLDRSHGAYPSPLLNPEREQCVDCGLATLSGIYTRLDPKTANYPHPKEG